MTEEVFETQGFQVRVNEAIPPGFPVAVLDGPVISGFVLHPLDLISLRFAGDALGRLEAVREYFIARAHRELDALAVRLGIEVSAEDIVDQLPRRGCTASLVLIDETRGFRNRPEGLSRNLQIAHEQFVEEQLERNLQRAARTREIQALTRRIREASAPDTGLQRDVTPMRAKPAHRTRYRVWWVRRLVYGLGFRPKRGSLFYSPSMVIMHSRTAADGWRDAFLSSTEEGKHR